MSDVNRFFTSNKCRAVSSIDRWDLRYQNALLVYVAANKILDTMTTENCFLGLLISDSLYDGRQ
jgi:hypothetical protein